MEDTTHSSLSFPRTVLIFFTAALAIGAALPESAEAQQRPMTFLDAGLMRRAGAMAISVDGGWMLYTVTTPNWEEAEQQSDIFLVSLAEGLPSTRQMTFTEEKNETSPQWSRDGSFFLFLSNRDATGNGNRNQLYLMRPGGGEARKLTDTKDGVANYRFSKDGRWLVYRSGRDSDAQLYRLPVEGIAEAEAEQITEQDAGIQQWQWAPDSRRIYFVTPDTLDADEEARREKGFTVDIKNMETPLASLWAAARMSGRRLA